MKYTPLLKRIKVGSVLTILSFIIFLTIAISAGIQNNHRIKKSPLVQFTEQNKGDYDGAIVYFNIEDIDASHRTIKFTSNVQASDKFFEKIKKNNDTLGLVIDNNVRTHTLKRNKPVEDTILIDFAEGEPDNYPFDSYIAKIEFKAYITLQEYINTKFQVDTIHQLFTIQLQHETKEESSIKYDLITLKVYRSILSKTTSFFINIILWFLPIGLAMLASHIFVNKLGVPPALLTLGPVMLFAIPAIRKAQPGIPEVGVLIDLFGYIWSVLIISISSIVMILCWVFRT